MALSDRRTKIILIKKPTHQNDNESKCVRIDLHINPGNEPERRRDSQNELDENDQWKIA